MFPIQVYTLHNERIRKVHDKFRQNKFSGSKDTEVGPPEGEVGEGWAMERSFLPLDKHYEPFWVGI